MVDSELNEIVRGENVLKISVLEFGMSLNMKPCMRWLVKLLRRKSTDSENV